jgi:hypothetical protein
MFSGPRIGVKTPVNQKNQLLKLKTKKNLKFLNPKKNSCIVDTP